MPQENGKPHFVRKPHRHWVNIFLIKYGDWELVPALIGRDGKNMSDIFVATNAKARVRGRGSGHLEFNCKGKKPKEAQFLFNFPSLLIRLTRITFRKRLIWQSVSS
jgi:hypothetical protein